MWRVFVRSRNGNLVLAIIGAVYAVASFAVLVWFITDVWEAASLLDIALQLSLIGAALCGLWFLSIGLQNLGVKIGRGGQSATGTSNPASVQR